MSCIEIIQPDDLSKAEWLYCNRKIHIDFIKSGGAIYSKKYKKIIAMDYKNPAKLDLAVYSINGEKESTVESLLPSDVIYQYISEDKASKSGVSVIVGLPNVIDGFYDWRFEVDVEKMILGKRLSRAY